MTISPRQFAARHRSPHWSLSTLTIIAIAVTCGALARAQQPTANPPAVLKMLPGLVQPSRTVALASPIGGPLSEVLVAEGEQVAEGQVLAVFDNRVAVASLHLAEAAANRQGAVARAQADLAAAESLLARVARARSERAASELELDQARSGVAVAQAALLSAREQLAEAHHQRQLDEARVESHNLRAPFAGTVLRIEHPAGDNVPPGHEVLTVVNLFQLRVELQVPLDWFGRLETGRHYPLFAEAPLHRTLPARLVYQEPAVDAATRSFRCVFEIENPAGQLPSGFSARLIDPSSPSAALFSSGWFLSQFLAAGSPSVH